MMCCDPPGWPPRRRHSNLRLYAVLLVLLLCYWLAKSLGWSGHL